MAKFIGRQAENQMVFPVLIHANGVSKNVQDSEYFYRIIDIRDGLRR